MVILKSARSSEAQQKNIIGGQNCRNFNLVPKILSAEIFCLPKILSAEILSDKVFIMCRTDRVESDNLRVTLAEVIDDFIPATVIYGRL